MPFTRSSESLYILCVLYFAMKMTTYGSADESKPKTPTLRQYLKKTGGRVAHESLVKRIFIPNQYETYTFVTDNGFKVSLYPGNSLFDFLVSNIDGFAEREEYLVIRVVSTTPLVWELASVDDYRIEWDRDDYGFTCADAKKRSAKEPSPKRGDTKS